MSVGRSEEPTFIVDFEPIGKRVELPATSTLLEAAQLSGIELISICGGIGACSGCRVRLIEGHLSRLTLAEEAELSPAERAGGWRLACQAEPLSDVKVDIPPESLTTPQRLQIEGEAARIGFDPSVRALDIILPAPDIHDLRSDVRRLEDHLHTHYRIGVATMSDLAHVLRAHDWNARLAVRNGGEIAAALPPSSRLLGLAVDIGTTGLAAYLIDLQDGETLAKTGLMNPQIAYGEDVISRIVYANDHSDGAQTLQTRLMAAINSMIMSLCETTQAQPAEIVDAVFVGNTAMHHLALGLPVRQLGEAPYVPVTTDGLSVKASALGLNTSPDACVYLPPNIAGYVGADHVSVLLASGAWDTSRTALIVDIGTNTEMTLVHQGRRLCCSCASGPAFEGAHIRDGMRAAPGAIERVQLIDGTLKIHTIGGKAAVGICGSGILDAVAVMADCGALDARGALNKAHPLVLDGDFVLALADQSDGSRRVGVSRKDVAEIQLAKAAIRTGIDLLLEAAEIEAEMIDDFIVAGAFGTYIQIESAVRIGLFPALPPERFKQVGNAAGMGACQLLVSKGQRDTAARLAEAVEYIELTTHPGFQAAYVERMGLER